MDRFLMDELVAWKDSPRRKPLILNGARQVGKTWLLKEFGRRCFDNVAYVNLDDNPGMREQFEACYDIPRIISAIQFETGQVVSEGGTLIVLDEIQACPKALTSLKYFCENAPGYAVAAAGSLLGITVHEGSGYPVGKVNTLNLHPLHFREFLAATGNRRLCELIDSGDADLINGFSGKLVPLLRQYYYVGGMPEAVGAFLERGLLEDAREVQLEILQGYERDISKHLGRTETEYALAAWRSIPAHLGRENKKFVFSHIAEGPARGTTAPASHGSPRRASRRSSAGFPNPASPWPPTLTTQRSNSSWSTSGCSERWRSWTKRRSSGETGSSRSSRGPSQSSTSASSSCPTAGSSPTTGRRRTPRAR